jgi:hypothetical protein
LELREIVDLLTFISKLIDALAWPLVVFILGLVFRKQVSDILPWVRKLKAGPVEAVDIEARKLLDDSKEAAANSPSISGDSKSKEQGPDVELALAKIYSAKQDPVKMILEGWSNVDGALFRFGKDAGILIDPMGSTNNVYMRVMSTDLLLPSTKKLVLEIHEMRNRVAHANIKPSINAAKDYLLAVEQVVRLIEKERETVERVDKVTW